MEHLLLALLGKSLNSANNLPTRDPFMTTNSMSMGRFCNKVQDYVTILLPFSVKHLKDGGHISQITFQTPSKLMYRLKIVANIFATIFVSAKLRQKKQGKFQEKKKKKTKTFLVLSVEQFSLNTFSLKHQGDVR